MKKFFVVSGAVLFITMGVIIAMLVITRPDPSMELVQAREEIARLEQQNQNLRYQVVAQSVVIESIRAWNLCEKSIPCDLMQRMSQGAPIYIEHLADLGEIVVWTPGVNSISTSMQLSNPIIAQVECISRDDSKQGLCAEADLLKK